MSFCSSPRRLKCPGFILILFLTILLEACGNREDAAQQPPLTPVKSILAQELEILDWDDYTGRIEAVETVDIKARVSGYLEKVLFKDGDRVKKGDLLFLIDARTYAADLKRAESELARTKSRLELAQNDFKRAERLRLSKAISDEEYDLRSKTVVENTATMHGAEAAVQTARLNYEFTQIRAPIDGRIGRELVTPGNLISGDQTTLTTIVSIDPVYVYIDTDERAVLKYRRLAASGQRANETEGRIPAQLRLIDESGYPHEGYIDYVDPRMDPSTGTLRVRALINNPDQILSPGLFAHIRIHGSAPHPVVLIPERAIGTDQDQKFVWVIREDHAVEYRKVSLGRLSGSFRVINDGLHSGEEIVVDGLPKIRPGAHVQAERLDLPYDG